MLDAYFHCDAYRLAAEIAEKYNLDRSEIIDELCEYFDAGDRDIAIPVWFAILLEEQDNMPIAKYVYEILSTYVDPPIGKIYLDF